MVSAENRTRGPRVGTRLSPGPLALVQLGVLGSIAIEIGGTDNYWTVGEKKKERAEEGWGWEDFLLDSLPPAAGALCAPVAVAVYALVAPRLLFAWRSLFLDLSASCTDTTIPVSHRAHRISIFHPRNGSRVLPGSRASLRGLTSSPTCHR